MADAQVLNQLHDIQLPQSIGWWPMASGWYFLMIIGLLLLTFMFYRFYRRRQYGRAKKEALDLLADLQKKYQHDGDSQEASMRISELLRRVALVYYPRQDVASLQGQGWIDFLNNTARRVDFNKVTYHLLEVPYQKSTDADLNPLFSCARTWIKQRGLPCSN
ncbi:DUF4381 domain-containing protein [Legionella hackeliae]|uniref:DUF4381 domain-containing protein n=1 Tax=Legionella hackeliae TaxID=449 RepID=A0A0A8UTE4_LEGHA|nr:DUF4381 domain-containing protein [Legionella hackeliae]KTD12678.1 hypothetical protein Lhac_1549 [Legionella hackeliae]CEK12095.1 conserved protein of unknown function [Legionella hackeliae]STX48883.1 Uncharacterised protein [Legionella hackeliae]